MSIYNIKKDNKKTEKRSIRISKEKTQRVTGIVAIFLAIINPRSETLRKITVEQTCKFTECTGDLIIGKIAITQTCANLAPFLTLIGLILLTEGNKKTKGIIIGIIGIQTYNIVRIIILAKLITINKEIAITIHNFLWIIMSNLIVVGFWYMWVKWISQENLTH